MTETFVAATVATVYQYTLGVHWIYRICANPETDPYNLYRLAGFWMRTGPYISDHGVLHMALQICDHL